MRFARCLAPALLLCLATGACSRTDATLAGSPSIETARVALAGGSADLALTICTNLLARRSSDPDLLTCRADALVALGRSAEAVGLYEQVLRDNGGSPGAKLGLGRIYLATDPARAEALFLDSLTSNPRNPAALNNLGIARDLQGRHALAQAAYGEAIAAAPDLRAPQVNLALSMAMSGRSVEAVRILRPIAERADATPRERHDYAAVLAMAGRKDEAGRLLRQDLDGADADEAVARYQALPSR